MMSTPHPLPIHLIIVCCHAIYLNNGQEGGSTNESNWLIEPFQAGETGTYIRHVKAGVAELAKNRENAILVFSGGATKKPRTERSEAEGYLDVALDHDLFGFETEVSSLRDRIFLDEYSTDSYQNILLSLIQFPLFARKLQQRLLCDGTKPPVVPSESKSTSKQESPTKLTIISHAFKRARFLNLHLPAIRFPVSRTTYIGIDPPFSTAKMAEIEEGDRLRGHGAWARDIYGAGEVLSRKREARGWDERVFRGAVLEKLGDVGERLQIERLMAWKGVKDGNEMYPWRTPWGSVA